MCWRTLCIVVRFNVHARYQVPLLPGRFWWEAEKVSLVLTLQLEQTYSRSWVSMRAVDITISFLLCDLLLYDHAYVRQSTVTIKSSKTVCWIAGWTWTWGLLNGCRKMFVVVTMIVPRKVLYTGRTDGVGGWNDLTYRIMIWLSKWQAIVRATCGQPVMWKRFLSYPKEKATFIAQRPETSVNHKQSLVIRNQNAYMWLLQLKKTTPKRAWWTSRGNLPVHNGNV